MRWMRRLGFAVMCLLIWSGCVLAESLDRIVAIVNGDVILYSELQEQVRALSRTAPDLKLDDPAIKSKVERELLQEMIRNHLADQEIKRLKIVVTSREVDETVEAIKQENNFTDAQFEYMIHQQGQTRDQFRQGIKKELERSRLVERVLKSKTIITPEQVDTFLKSEASGVGEKRRLAILFLPYPEGAAAQKLDEIDKQARDIMNRLKGGADFAGLAREYSKGPAASEGGDLGYIPKDELSPQIEAATRGLRPGDTTDLLKTPAGYFILKVLDIRQEKVSSVDNAAREKAQRQLMQIEVNRKFQDWVRDLESRAFIQISL